MALVKRKVSRLYTDLDLAFGKNFFSDDIDKKIDVNSVKQSIKILLSTMPYERPFHPEIGSDIHKSLFEPMDAFTPGLIKKRIYNTIENFEPRVELEDVVVTSNYDLQVYEASIYFKIVGVPEPAILTLTLSRLR